MLDTNVLVSLLLFSGRSMNIMMEHIFIEHELVLSSFVIDELKGVVANKFPTKVKAVNDFLLKMNYDFVNTPKNIDNTLFNIRDAKDYPVLYSAIIGNVDVLITGDKDFVDIEIKRPEVLLPADFIAKYL